MTGQFAVVDHPDMAHRLETVDAPLFEALTDANDAERRQVRIAVATWIVQRVDLHREPIANGLNALAENGSIADETRSAVRQLADGLDEAAWDKHDQLEAGTAAEIEYKTAFGLARAAAAVLFALDEMNADAAAETCYEAQAAVDDISEVRRLVYSCPTR